MLRSPRFYILVIIIFVAFAFLLPQNPIQTVRHAEGGSPPVDSSVAPSKGKAPLGSSADVKNSTLGVSNLFWVAGCIADLSRQQFERIFVINLPERYDKLDAFSLAASVTGFTHDVIEGIKGSTVVNKTLPALEGLPQVTILLLAFWSSQRLTQDVEREIAKQYRWLLARALELCTKVSAPIFEAPQSGSDVGNRIVRDRIVSALVLEDDSDWDVSIKDQLADIATGSRYISGTRKTPRSPYGDDWDLLWLGHCSAQQDPSDTRRFVIENDATVPPPNHRQNFNKVPALNEMGYDNTTRIVFRAHDGVCLYSYALSFRGAQKVLWWQNNVKKFYPIDMGIGYQCRDDPHFKCVAVFPQVVDSHKGAGRQSRDSDIGTFDPTKVREKGYTQNIVRSTRLNVENIMHGNTIEDQWPDVPQLTGPRRIRFD
ncbi:MAG: hypothetical protein Q9184_004368 [Pyrenodesmia sp. 2 TL-2023]